MYDTLKAGQIPLTVGGTAQQLIGIPSGSRVRLKANAANTGSLYLGGDNSVSATAGYELAKGESVDINVVNPSKVWFNGPTSADRLSWLVVAG